MALILPENVGFLGLLFLLEVLSVSGFLGLLAMLLSGTVKMLI